tara:strand:+ start:487 stop:900 length:414 start_codon:yes stop_codon:yes gene_type:complete
MSEIKHKDLILPSNEKFGRFFSVVFILIAIYFYYLELNSYAFIFLGISTVLIVISLFKSNLLFPLNIAWMRLGNILGRIISPLVLGLIFFILFTPISFFTYFFGRDELNLRKKNNKKTFWKIKDDQTKDPDFFNNQF